MALQLETLKDCHSDEELRHALNTLPQSLPETYERIISSLKVNSSRRRILQVLAWIMFAKISPSLQVVAAVYSINTETGNLFPIKESFPSNARDILTWCAGLFVQAEGPSMGTSISIAHFSVKDYFVEVGKDYRFGRYDLSEEKALAFISDTCLYLLVSPGPDSLSWLSEQTTPKAETICDYAAIHCISHFKDSDAFREDEFLPRNIRQLFLSRDNSALRKWAIWYARSVSKLRVIERLPRIPSYFYAHKSVDGDFSGEDVLHRGIFCSPLHVATNFELIDVVKWLLEHNRDATDLSQMFTRTILGNGDETDSQREKDQLDANTRCPDPKHCCEDEIPLYYALMQGSLELFTILLGHGADPQVKCNAQSMQSRVTRVAEYRPYEFSDDFVAEPSTSTATVLQMATVLQRNDIVRVILDHAELISVDSSMPGAYPEDEDRDEVRNRLLMAAFATACTNADTDISKFVLTFGKPEVLLDHECIDTFLIMKARKGDSGVVKLLFALTEEYITPFNDDCYHSAFLEACQAPSSAVAEHLYSLRRLDLQRTETVYGFLRACRDSVFEHLILDMLTEGIDVNLEVPLKALKTPLQNACFGKNLDVVNLLLNLGADVIASSAGRGRFGAIQLYCGYHHDVETLTTLLQSITAPGTRIWGER